MVDLNNYGIDEPTVKSLVDGNADVILFSGDKLLGGPQAGIIIGKSKYINKMRKHPLARAFRVDKYTLAALNATLFEYYDEKSAMKNIPILNMITIKKEELRTKAEKIYKMFSEKLKDNKSDKNSIESKVTLEVEEIKDQVGGGTVPNVFLDGYAISLVLKDKASEKIERELRDLDVPIIARVAHDKVYFDVRTILDDDINLIIDEINSII